MMELGIRLLSYSMKNVRSFTNATKIPVRPITLIVGANSTGKSTILRLLPLLRQSVETKTRGPLLWYGPYVDMGSYGDIQPKFRSENDVVLGFQIRLLKAPSPPWRTTSLINDDIDVGIEVGLCHDKASERTYVHLLNVSIESNTVSARFSPEGRIVSYALNDNALPLSGVSLQISQDGHLFGLNFIDEDAKRPNKLPPWRMIWPYNNKFFLDDALLGHIESLFHGRSEDDTRRSFLTRFAISSLDSLRKRLSGTKTASDFTNKRIVYISSNDDWVCKLQGLLLADRFPYLINQLDSSLALLFKNITYMGPIRATASRYYRQQDLATDEVDAQGGNMAMFLANLSEDDREAFSRWCKESMGFSVSVLPTTSHVSVLIEDSAADSKHNIADMGFGYSQILPLLTTMWAAQRKYSVGKSTVSDFTYSRYSQVNQTILLVEQPELHLHPKMQANLADLYCNIVAQSAIGHNDISFVIETHSETIINRVGKLIHEKRIKPTDVAVLIVEKDAGSSSLTTASFDEDGYLVDWPYGFFLP
jgi:hypothetical protein